MKLLKKTCTILFMFAGILLLSKTAEAAPFITGTVYTDQGVTTMGAGKTVRLLVQGLDSTLTAETDAGGNYSIDLAAGSIYLADDILTLFLDDETEDGVTITVGAVDDAGITGLDIYQDTLIARSESLTFIGNKDFDSGHSGDADISTIFVDDTSTSLTTGIATFRVWSDTTYAPAGDVTLKKDVYIDGTYVSDTETFLLDSTNGPFDPGVGNTYNNFQSNGGLPLRVINNPLVTVDFTNSAIIDLEGLDLTVSGTYNNGGTMRAYGNQSITVAGDENGGIWRFDGDGDSTQDTYDIGAFFDEYDYVSILDTNPVEAETDIFTTSKDLLFNEGISIENGSFVTNDFDLDLNLSLSIEEGLGKLYAGSSTIYLKGSLDVYADGDFIYEDSTLVIDGYIYIESDLTFCNVIVRDDVANSTDVELTIVEGTTLTIATGCTFELDGLDADDRASIISDGVGNEHYIDVIDGESAVSADFASIIDSHLLYNGVTADPEFPALRSDDGGNTDGWFGISLVYEGGAYAENDVNDGSIDNTDSLVIFVAGDEFVDLGSGFLTSAQVKVRNIPAGLSPVLTIDSEIQATLTLTGNAIKHTSQNDISNITFEFEDSAFLGGDVSAIAKTGNPTPYSSNVGIDFIGSPISSSSGNGSRRISKSEVADLFGKVITNDNSNLTTENKKCAIVYTRLIKKGIRGEDVKQVQKCMNALGYTTGPEDGIYGPLTYLGVTAYQRAKGLRYIDGIVGPETSGSLNILHI